jgi:SAM-dependent methyltransferase
MCHPSVLEFCREYLTSADVHDKRVLEVGSLDVNGSPRDHVLGLGPTRYWGVDLEDGSGVDEVMSFMNPLPLIWLEKWDVVICTEMLEHAQDWRLAVSNLKRALCPYGTLLVTTRSKGFARHYEHPGDFWRFELGDMRAIFSDFDIITLIADPGGPGGGPGVFLKARRPHDFSEHDLSTFNVYSMDAER